MQGGRRAERTPLPHLRRLSEGVGAAAGAADPKPGLPPTALVPRGAPWMSSSSSSSLLHDRSRFLAEDPGLIQDVSVDATDATSENTLCISRCISAAKEYRCAFEI